MLNQSELDSILGIKSDESKRVKRTAVETSRSRKDLTVLEQKGNNLITYSAPWFNATEPEAYYLQQNSQFCYKGVELPRGKCRRMFKKSECRVMVSKDFFSLF